MGIPGRVACASLLLGALGGAGCNHVAEDGLTPTCRAYVNAYSNCLVSLQGDDAARVARVETVRAGLRLPAGASDEEQAAAEAKCSSAKEKLTCP